MKICCFGSLNMDYIYNVEHFALAGETIPTYNRMIACGGKGLNQSIAMARSGANVYHAGNVGAMDGQLLLNTLQNNGVNISLVTRQNMASGHAVIQVDQGGENCILLYGGTNQMVTEDQISEVLGFFSEHDIVVLQNEINMLSEIVSAAHKKGMRVVLNPSPTKNIRKMVPLEYIDILFANREEICTLGERVTVKESMAVLKTQYPQMTIVCTLGREGAIVYHGDDEVVMPAFCVTPIDTTGAGDTFLGYYVGLMSQGKNIHDCLRYATAAAALSVQKKGASVSIPLLEEVEEFLRG